MPDAFTPTEPGLWERGVCWVDPNGLACVRARTARYNVDNTELQHHQDLAEQTIITAEAQAGATDAIRQSMFNQAATAALIVVPPLLLVVGGIGGYLWWRRGKREEAALEAEIAAETLAEAVVE